MIDKTAAYELLCVLFNTVTIRRFMDKFPPKHVWTNKNALFTEFTNHINTLPPV